MRKWGLAVTVFYAAAVLLLLIPAGVVLVGECRTLADLGTHVQAAYGFWLTWLYVGVVMAGEILLVMLSVDTSERRLKPRTRIGFSIATAGMLLAALTFSAVACIAVAIKGDRADDWATAVFIGGLFAPWVLWSIAFYRYSRNSDDVVTRAVSWLLRGSVLELLIAVPSHVIVRRRQDCCAPMVSGFGIATGIAIMLLSFGPSVIFLFKKRMDGLKAKGASA